MAQREPRSQAYERRTTGRQAQPADRPRPPIVVRVRRWRSRRMCARRKKFKCVCGAGSMAGSHRPQPSHDNRHETQTPPRLERHTLTHTHPQRRHSQRRSSTTPAYVRKRFNIPHVAIFSHVGPARDGRSGSICVWPRACERVLNGRRLGCAAQQRAAYVERSHLSPCCSVNGGPSGERNFLCSMLVPFHRGRTPPRLRSILAQLVH